MPKLNFTDIGDLQDYRYSVATIKAIDSATDTCTLNQIPETALIFYHCAADSVLRSNGAITGGSAGFAVGSSVVVLQKHDKSKTYVVAHTDGIRACGGYAVFVSSFASLSKSVAIIWDIKNNVLVMGPIDTTDVLYTGWIAAHGVNGTSLYPAFAKDSVIPYKLRPDLVDPIETLTYRMRYHANTTSPTEMFPESVWSAVDNGSVPIGYSGLRTSEERQIAGTYEKEYSDDHHVTKYWTSGPPWPSYPPSELTGGERGSSNNTYNYVFHGPLGEMGGFAGTYVGSFLASGGGSWLESYDYTRYKIPEWIPTSSPGWSPEKQYALGRAWYGSFMAGACNESFIAHACLVHYTPCSYRKFNPTQVWPQVLSETWSFSSRIILVQAQALFYGVGISRENYAGSGRNTALETKLTEAVVMSYALNSVPIKEIRDCRISVELR